MSDQQQMRSVIIILMAVALLVSGSVAFLMISKADNESAGEAIKGDFILNSSSGPVSLHQFHGQVVLLFFGYTHCPDVCPATMTNVADAMDLLSERERQLVQPLFITVDPTRDSVEHLTQYVSFFHPKLIGLSGSEDQIRKAAELFSVQYFRDDWADAGKGNYYLNHTSYLFLINPGGEIADLMSDHTTPQDIAASVRQYVSR